MYGPISPENINFRLIHVKRQGDKSIQKFYSTITRCWDQLAIMEPVTLSGQEVYQNFREERRSMQFLMALRYELRSC